MSLYAEQHKKKIEGACPHPASVDAAPPQSAEKENVRFRRSSRPALPIGSASKQSSGSAVLSDSPGPRVPLNACAESRAAKQQQQQVTDPSARKGSGRKPSRDPSQTAPMPVSASHTPSLPSSQQEAVGQGTPVVEQDAVAHLLTRASEALKAERQTSSDLAHEKAQLQQALQSLCDCYMSLEATVTATPSPQLGRDGPSASAAADTTALGRQVRAIAQRFQLQLSTPPRHSIAVATPRDQATQATAKNTAVAATSHASTPQRHPSCRPSPRETRRSVSAHSRQHSSLAPAADADAAPSVPPLPRARSASATVASRESHAAPDACDGPLAVFSAARGAAAQEAMAGRLRRALAPQPTREQVGDVIDAMVEAIQRDPARVIPAAAVPGGPRFHLTRVSPCTYRLAVGTAAALYAHAGTSQHALNRTNSARRDAHNGVQESLIHLVINSGSLRVVRGGGPVDFFDFMDRKLRLMQRSD